MPFQVRNVMFDTIDTKGMRAGGLKRAEALIAPVGNNIAGTLETLTINYPSAPAAIVLTESTDWTNTGTNAGNARAIAVAVRRNTNLPVIAEIADPSTNPTTFKLTARTQGTWAQAITVVSSNVAIIEVNGVASSTLRLGTYNTDGLGPQAFQAWLDANVPAIGGGAGDRIAGSLKIKPLTSEGSSFLVTWEEN